MNEQFDGQNQNNDSFANGPFTCRTGYNSHMVSCRASGSSGSRLICTLYIQQVESRIGRFNEPSRFYHPTSPPSHFLKLNSGKPASLRRTHRSSSYTSYAPAACFIACMCLGPLIALMACRRLSSALAVFVLGPRLITHLCQMQVARLSPVSSGTPYQYMTRPPLCTASSCASRSAWYSDSDDDSGLRRDRKTTQYHSRSTWTGRDCHEPSTRTLDTRQLTSSSQLNAVSYLLLAYFSSTGEK